MNKATASSALRRWIAKRSLREKVMAVLALLVAFGLLFDTAINAPQRAQAAALKRQLNDARHAIAKLQALALEQSMQSDQLQREQVTALAARRARAEQVIRDAQVDLIAPQEMGKQLAAILARFPELRVVSMTTLAPTPLGEPASPKAAVPGAAPNAPRAASGLYQHGLEVAVEGRYLDVLAYLQALEKAPYRIYWREFDLQVNSDGVPVTRIALFTLSRETVWLKL